MEPRIGLKELIILTLCFLLYIVAVEVFEDRVVIARQGQLVEQETSFTYQPPEPPKTSDGQTVTIELDE